MTRRVGGVGGSEQLLSRISSIPRTNQHRFFEELKSTPPPLPPNQVKESPAPLPKTGERETPLSLSD
jgi:hypothetical protein